MSNKITYTQAVQQYEARVKEFGDPHYRDLISLHLATLYDLAEQLDQHPEPLMLGSSLRTEWANTIALIEEALS